MKRIKILKIYLWVMTVFLAFWWPLSHWFYPDWYHNLLGFESYDYSLVKIIGTCGIIPTLMLAFAAINPIKNRDIIKTIIVYAIAMIFTYIFLINTQEFPKEEYLNVILLSVNIIILSVLYPWRNK